MEVYKKWVSLVSESIQLTENLQNQIFVESGYYESGLFEDSLNKIPQIQNTLSLLGENARKRSESGIQAFSDDALESYGALSGSYDIYKEYLELLISEDYDSAEEKYEEYSQSYSKAMSMGTDEESSITDSINEIDSWYQKNIGVCFDFFEKYSS